MWYREFRRVHCVKLRRRVGLGLEDMRHWTQPKEPFGFPNCVEHRSSRQMVALDGSKGSSYPPPVQQARPVAQVVEHRSPKPSNCPSCEASRHLNFRVRERLAGFYPVPFRSAFLPRYTTDTAAKPQHSPA